MGESSAAEYAPPIMGIPQSSGTRLRHWTAAKKYCTCSRFPRPPRPARSLSRSSAFAPTGTEHDPREEILHRTALRESQLPLPTGENTAGESVHPVSGANERRTTRRATPVRPIGHRCCAGILPTPAGRRCLLGKEAQTRRYRKQPENPDRAIYAQRATIGGETHCPRSFPHRQHAPLTAPFLELPRLRPPGRDARTQATTELPLQRATFQARPTGSAPNARNATPPRHAAGVALTNTLLKLARQPAHRSDLPRLRPTATDASPQAMTNLPLQRAVGRESVSSLCARLPSKCCAGILPHPPGNAAYTQGRQDVSLTDSKCHWIPQTCNGRSWASPRVQPNGKHRWLPCALPPTQD